MAPGTELKYVEAEENNQSFRVLKHKHKVQKFSLGKTLFVTKFAPKKAKHPRI